MRMSADKALINSTSLETAKESVHVPADEIPALCDLKHAIFRKSFFPA